MKFLGKLADAINYLFEVDDIEGPPQDPDSFWKTKNREDKAAKVKAAADVLKGFGIALHGDADTDQYHAAEIKKSKPKEVKLPKMNPSGKAVSRLKLGDTDPVQKYRVTHGFTQSSGHLQNPSDDEVKTMMSREAKRVTQQKLKPKDHQPAIASLSNPAGPLHKRGVEVAAHAPRVHTQATPSSVNDPAKVKTRELDLTKRAAQPSGPGPTNRANNPFSTRQSAGPATPTIRTPSLSFHGPAPKPEAEPTTKKIHGQTIPTKLLEPKKHSPEAEAKVAAMQAKLKAAGLGKK